MYSFSTPMMRQYQVIKAKYPECLLLYRMGDFYELFLEDAQIGSKILNITLTSKSGGKDGKIPMAGIPYHAVDSYLAKLVKAGYKVAICEQLSPPNKRGLVERDVIRVVTPGTMLDENALDKKENNYLISVATIDDKASFAVSDLSTGYFAVSEKEGDYREWLIDELARLEPSECILSDELYNDGSFLKLLKMQQGMNIYPLQQWIPYANNAEKILKEHFGVATLAAFGIEEKKLSMQTAATLLGYLQETQKTTVQHIKKITLYETKTAMILDKSTIINLEIFSTIREHDTKGSLLSLLDKTMTAMGGRMLKEWIKKPLLDKETIAARHECVEIFVKKSQQREKLRSLLEEIPDIERTLSRLAIGVGNPRDLITIRLALQRILDVKTFLKKDGTQKNRLYENMVKQISLNLQKVIQLIEKNIVTQPPIDTKGGGIIVENVHKQLDSLRNVITESKEWMADLEQKERKSTGINSLKIRYNQVFGFYIEVSKSNAHLVPSTYQRKQTLVNGERFTTKDLKKHEEIILTAEEKANELEYQLFTKLLQDVLHFTQTIQQAAQAIAVIDCLTTFAYISQIYHFTRPKILYSGEIRITQGRHPVVEKLLGPEKQFVPNDVCLDNISQSLLLITGPNMAGKSVFIRQVALIVLLCQIGCFVPAKSAHISLVDRIFVRSGAADVITSGLSTFMVEMVETAHILHNATSKSLILMDEIGRGTSTYDGISLAWAIAEYLVTHFTPSPKTLFATHYHELQQLEEEHPHAIKNFHMAVAGDTDQPVFLHTLFPGGASHSFGVTVAKLAGIPEEIISKAALMLHDLENRNQQEQFHKNDDQQKKIVSLEEKNTRNVLIHMIRKELEGIDIINITPLEAMNTLAKIKDQLKLLKTQSSDFLNRD